LIASDVNHEAYELDLFNKNTWRLYADYYPGFLRGLETLSQLFEKNQNDQYEIVGLPIAIKDVPDFKWRGLMIDTSRHYLPVTTIKRAIDSMLYSKLNVLHWHIIDEDSFPMEVPNVPELSEFGSVGGVFSE
jgi:hexosaminidase